MKITKIITEWENKERFSIEEPEVTQFLEAGGNTGIQMYLILAFAKKLSGGFNWRKCLKVSRPVPDIDDVSSWVNPEGTPFTVPGRELLRQLRERLTKRD